MTHLFLALTIWMNTSESGQSMTLRHGETNTPKHFYTSSTHYFFLMKLEPLDITKRQTLHLLLDFPGIFFSFIPVSLICEQDSHMPVYFVTHYTPTPQTFCNEIINTDNLIAVMVVIESI